MKGILGQKDIRWERVFRDRQDLLMLLFLLLVGLGAAALFSASYNFCRIYLSDPLYMIRRQLWWIGVGTLSAYLITRLPLSLIRDSVPWILAFTVFINLLTYIPGIGVVRGGAQRWVEIFGYSFQPSELVKVSMVLYLARMLEKNRKRLDDWLHVILPLYLVTLFFTALIYFQNDFSSALFVFILSMAIIFLAGANWKHLLSMVGISVVPLILMIFARSYRIERILTWFSPMKDPSGAGYQILQSREALVQGGFWGRGIGRGIEKIGFSAAHSDFVVAVIGEETGFLGIAILLGLFYLLLVKGVSLGLSRKSLFRYYTVTGLVIAFFIQVLVNFSVVCGLVPVTGIPLPFFSSGGSSTMTAFIMFGLIFNMAGKEKKASSQGDQK